MFDQLANNCWIFDNFHISMFHFSRFHTINIWLRKLNWFHLLVSASLVFRNIYGRMNKTCSDWIYFYLGVFLRTSQMIISSHIWQYVEYVLPLIEKRCIRWSDATESTDNWWQYLRRRTEIIWKTLLTYEAKFSIDETSSKTCAICIHTQC